MPLPHNITGAYILLTNFTDVESLTMISYSVEDKIGSFRIWAAHAGAQRSGSVYRLHEAPHVHLIDNDELSRMLTPRR